MMTDEWRSKKNSKEVFVFYVWYYLRICVGGLRKTTNNLSTESYHPAEIRVEHFPNTNVEPYMLGD
jgi:hypothetical protein